MKLYGAIKIRGPGLVRQELEVGGLDDHLEALTTIIPGYHPSDIDTEIIKSIWKEAWDFFWSKSYLISKDSVAKIGSVFNSFLSLSHVLRIEYIKGAEIEEKEIRKRIEEERGSVENRLRKLLGVEDGVDNENKTNQ